MKRNFFLAVICLAFVSVFVFTPSCRKPKPPKAVVTVLSEKNEPIEGATVIVKAPSSGDAHTIVYLLNEDRPIADTQKTNSEGKVFYEFKYEAVYKVEVNKKKDKKNPEDRIGVGILILENDKTTDQKIVISPYSSFTN